MTGTARAELFKLVLSSSLPHAAWGARPEREVVLAAHRLAWESATGGEGRWVHLFLAERSLPAKLGLLLDAKPTPDAGSQAIAQCLPTMLRERAAAFAFALYPAASRGRLPVGAEGVNDLARVAAPILSVDGEVRWQERLRDANTRPPQLDRFARALAKPELVGGRAERARQLFTWCAVENVVVAGAEELEQELHGCVELLRTRGLA